MNPQPARRSVLHILRSALMCKAPEQAKQNIQPPQRPAEGDRDAWHVYWDVLGQPWRTEPEIEPKRQEELAQCRTITPDIEKGVYPFKGARLNRADIEWLLATHKKGRMGLDLRGANLQFVDLSNLPLAKMRGGLFGEEWLRSTAEQRRIAAVYLEGANLRGSHLERSALSSHGMRNEMKASKQ